MDLKCEGKEGLGLETLQWIHTYKIHIYVFIYLFIYFCIYIYYLKSQDTLLSWLGDGPQVRRQGGRGARDPAVDLHVQDSYIFIYLFIYLFISVYIYYLKSQDTLLSWLGDGPKMRRQGGRGPRDAAVDPHVQDRRAAQGGRLLRRHAGGSDGRGP